MVGTLQAEGRIVGNAQVSSLFHAERIEYEAVKAIEAGADRVFLNRSVGTSTGAGPAVGLLARRPDLIVEEAGTYSAIEVASKAQEGAKLASRAEEAMIAGVGYADVTVIESFGYRMPFSIGGVRTIGTSALPSTYGLGVAGALDIGLGSANSAQAAQGK